MSVLDALAFSSVWVAVAALLLALVTQVALALPVHPALLVFVFTGTFVVYACDRLRDVERDRTTTPRRAAFVVRHRPLLLGATAVATVVVLACVPALGPWALLPAAIGAIPGLLHRRLKHFAWKPAYITTAWVAVTVGLPVAASARGAEAARVGWLGAVQGLTLLANVLASGVRDHEGLAARIGSPRALGVARTAAAAGVVVALSAPAPLPALAALPLATLAVLLGFRPDERYGLVVVDGALVAGAAATLLVLAVGR